MREVLFKYYVIDDSSVIIRGVSRYVAIGNASIEMKRLIKFYKVFLSYFSVLLRLEEKHSCGRSRLMIGYTTKIDLTFMRFI